MIARVLPITQVKPDLKDSVRMAVSEIERFLAMFHPIDVIRKQQSALAIAGHWLSRVKGFHDDDDFLYLVRDFLSWVLSGGERSHASDQLSFFFSGFMPSYGTARTFLDIVNDGGTWLDVRAFMHSQAYGSAKRYVEAFDWSAGKQKAQTEAQAWLDVIKEEHRKLSAAPTLLAFVAPDNSPWLAKPPVTDVPNPVLPAAESEGSGLARLLVRVPLMPIIVGITLLTYSPNAGDPDEVKKLREQQDAYAKQMKLAIPAPSGTIATQVNTQKVIVQTQQEQNKKSGERCENDGYVIMEESLNYKRLIEPPKGKGLDGLFEKLPLMDQPDPAPPVVSRPAPGGDLIFVPEQARPPQPQYNYTNPRSGTRVYPRYVVFEAKNIAKVFGKNDATGIKNTTKQRLGETKSGKQMGRGWIAKRIPQALDRRVRSGEVTQRDSIKKQSEIKRYGYARWIFVCLPGPVGAQSKLFVFIDVDQAGLNLDPPKPEASPKETQDSGYD